ncbi:MAG: Ig-like domain-containing protein [Candidatus Tectomicrobia bacterium]|nr:Ig-like domain-containing protein [Candidatus Tectomicrobia bacterium]
MTSRDCLSVVRTTFADPYIFSGRAGQRITLELTSADFDAYLILFDSTGSPIAEDDDSGGERNSRILDFVLPESGDYIFEATSFGAGGSGDYALSLQLTGETGGAGGACATEPLDSNASVQGSLLEGDCQSRRRADAFADLYTFFASAGQRVTIDLQSSSFDAFLLLVNEGGETIASNDDRASGDRNALITDFEIPADGAYTIEVTSFGAVGAGDFFGTGGTGDYQLALQSGEAPPAATEPLSISPESTTARPGATVTFTASGSDVDQNPGGIIWSAPGASFVGSSVGVAQVTWLAPSRAGSFEVVVTSQEGGRAVAQVTVEGTVVPPTTTLSIAPQTATTAPGQVLAFVASGSAVTQNLRGIIWSAPGASFEGASVGVSSVRWRAPSQAGQYQVIVTSADGRRAAASVTVGAAPTPTPTQPSGPPADTSTTRIDPAGDTDNFSMDVDPNEERVSVFIVGVDDALDPNLTLLGRSGETAVFRDDLRRGTGEERLIGTRIGAVSADGLDSFIEGPPTTNTFRIGGFGSTVGSYLIMVGGRRIDPQDEADLFVLEGELQGTSIWVAAVAVDTGLDLLIETVDANGQVVRFADGDPVMNDDNGSGPGGTTASLQNFSVVGRQAQSLDPLLTLVASGGAERRFRVRSFNGQSSGRYLLVIGSPQVFGEGGGGPTPGASSLAIDPSEASIQPGETLVFTALGGAAEFNVGGLVWSASAGTFTTSVFGTASASWQAPRLPGVYRVQVTSSDGGQATAEVRVEGVAPRQQFQFLSITPNAPVLQMIGDTVQLRALGFGPLGTEDITEQVEWAAANGAVASVSDTGLVTAQARGLTRVTASFGSLVGSATVSVQGTGAVQIGRLVVTPSTFTLRSVGATVQLSAVLVQASGRADVSSSATWNSSNRSVAVVSSSGRVSAVGSGAAVISASAQGVSSSATITVTLGPQPRSLQVTPQTSTISTLDGTVQLSALGTFADGSTRDLTRSVAWRSSNDSVAVVSGSGSVRARGDGTAAVTATSEGVSAAAVITVASGAGVLTVSVAPATPTLSQVGATTQLTATSVSAAGATQDVTSTASWSSSAENVATVSPRGLVTAVAAGSAVITASVNGAQGSASVTVRSLDLLVTPSEVTIGTSRSRTLTALGGVAPFLWAPRSGSISGDATGASVTYTAASLTGTDAVIVRDSTGLQAQVSVTVVTALSANPTRGSLQPRGTQVFDAVQGTSPYTWLSEAGELSTNTGNRVIYTAPNTTGRHTLTLRDSAGQSVDITITVAQPVTVEPPTSNVSRGGRGQFIASGGVPPYSTRATCGTSSEPDVRGNFTFSAPGTLGQCILQVSDAENNLSQAVAFVTDDPVISPATASIAPSGILVFNVAGGSSPYQWSASSGTLTSFAGTVTTLIGPPTAGQFTVTVRDRDGKTATATLSVTIPPAITPATATIGPQETATFTATNGSGEFTWTATAGTLSSTSGATITYTAPRTAGQFTIGATDTNQDSTFAMVFVIQDTISVSPSTVVMDPNATQLFTVTGGTGRFSWASQAGNLLSTAGTSVTYIAPSITGDFRLTATDTAGNQGVAAVSVAGTIRITPATATMRFGETRTFRALRGTGDFTWESTAGQLSATSGDSVDLTAPQQVGTVNVILRDNADNQVVANIAVVNDAIQITPRTAQMQVNESRLFQAVGGTGSFSWEAEAGSISSTVGTSITYTAPSLPGEYTISVLDSSGNGGTARAVVAAPAGAITVAPETLDLEFGEVRNLTAAGGSGQYRWELEGAAVGTVAPETGSNVRFSAASTAGAASLRVRDVNAPSVSAVVSVTVRSGVENGTRPVITMAGFGTTADAFSSTQGGTIKMMAQVVDNGGPGNLTVEVFLGTASEIGTRVQTKFFDMTDADGDGIFEFSQAFPGLGISGDIPLPGLTIRATDADGNVTSWPNLDVRGVAAPTFPQAPVPSLPSVSVDTPVILMAGFGTTPYTYGGTNGGSGRIQALVTGGAAPVRVEVFIEVRDPINMTTTRAPIVPLADPDGDGLYSAEFPLGAGAFSLGEQDFGLIIVATGANGRSVTWPHLNIVR